METTNLAVLTQWLIFFVAIATVFVPAFLFRKIALKRNKKGWLYFLAGMGVGFLCLPLSRFLEYWMMEHDLHSPSYLSGLIAFLVIPVMVVTLAVMVLGGRLARVE